MSEPLLPDQFLYSRKGPWPQPSPSHPMKCADEVLNIPPMEELLFNETIGARYLKARVGYPPMAAMYAAEQSTWGGPTDARFNEIMIKTLFTRFKRDLTAADMAGAPFDFSKGKWWKYDFTAMDLVDPIDGTYCAATKVYFRQDGTEDPNAVCIKINNVWITPSDNAWMLAKIYALQGGAYHVLFVVHPALHFPMDSVNAITKTSVPMGHPLFQFFHPHSAYSLPLDNAVLESAESVVNNNAQGTRFDPLTANAYNLKLLFGAGYTGLPSTGHYTNGYPVYDYMEPQLDFDSGYSTWLSSYYRKAFLPFARKIAHHIMQEENMMDYVKQWAKYCSTHVLGFPDEKMIQDPEVLAKAMAIYTWNASVSHGGDHWSFSQQVTPVEKCLRIRIPPPATPQDNPEIAGKLFTGNDMQRAALCQYMFFQTWAIKPNLNETLYAFTDPVLQAAQKEFHQDLQNVDAAMTGDCKFQPLSAPQGDEAAYAMTIPQSIQY